MEVLGYDEIHFDRWDEGGQVVMALIPGYLINDDAGATMVDLYLSELERLFGSAIVVKLSVPTLNKKLCISMPKWWH